MRDIDIRLHLRKELHATFGRDEATLIVDELGICNGSARADMAVINGELKGFEIKSQFDTLVRLPGQVDLYGRVFDSMSIVVDERHLEKVESLIPDWWGVVLARQINDSRIELSKVRLEQRNTEQDALSIIRLLWKDEVLELLGELGFGRGLKGRPRRYLWEVVVSNLTLNGLQFAVRELLKKRKDWRVGRPQMRGDAMSQPSSMWSDSLSSPSDSRTY